MLLKLCSVTKPTVSVEPSWPVAVIAPVESTAKLTTGELVAVIVAGIWILSGGVPAVGLHYPQLIEGIDYLLRRARMA